MTSKKLILGITAPLSIVLLEGQLKYFKDKGYEVFLMAPGEKVVKQFCQEEEASLLPVNIKREISIIQDFKSLFQIIQHLKKIKPDIVNVGTPKMGLLGMIGANVTGVKKRIYTCRGFRYEHEKGIKRMVLIKMEKLTAKIAHKVICISPSVQEMGLRDNIFPPEKAIVIGRGSSNGLNTNKFRKEAVDLQERKILSEKLELSEKFVFGFVGRIVDRKGITELYNAFDKLFQKHTNFHLVIVGKTNIEQVSDKTLIKKLMSHPGITLTGYQEDVPLYMSLFDIFVLPAWWEGFGNTLIQAAAMGLPVISTRVTGCRDAVKDGFNGVLIKEKSVEELSSIMEEFFLNKELRERLGSNGLIWAKEFDSETIWNGMQEVYES